MIQRLLFLFLIAIFLLVQCANPIPLTGGEKDETPPGIDSLRSTPNMQTNFEKQTIELTFDEWIRLNDVFKQVVISPPITPRPDIKLKGKTVSVNFDETSTLRENATYTINFGEAIQDLSERNSPNNLRFVFSTGDFIDSLKVEGQVRDVEKNEAQKDILIMLYDNLADSVVRTESPFYFAKTDKNGHAHIENVRSDTFKVVALEDKNQNYRYDASERIAFLENPIIVTDSIQPELNLQLFLAREALKIIAKDSLHYGRTDILFNQKVNLQDLMFKYEEKPATLFFEANKDTLHIWYDLESLDSWELFLQQDTLLKDTLAFKNSGRVDFLKIAKLRPYKKLAANRTITPGKTVALQWNRPLVRFDTTLMRLSSDSLATPLKLNVQIDSTASYRTLQLNHNWKAETNYTLELLPGAVTDIYGVALADTLQQQLSVPSNKAFGNMELSVIGLDSTQQYLIEVIGNNTTILTAQVQNDSIYQSSLKWLKAGVYSVKVISDINRNGYWDTGDYDLKQQAEPIFNKKLEPLRASWDLEAEVDIRQKSKTADIK